jgi:paraquat-inducible protein A
MTSPAKIKSLSQKYPHHFEVPILIFLSAACLVVGLSLPLMNVEKMVFWKNDYSVFTGIVSLAKDGQILLALVVFFFSMVFPFVKLTWLLVLWWMRLSEARRKAALRWLGLLGKWSMLDVFAVSILIVLVKIGPLANVKPKPGIYFFCSAILASMLITTYVEHLARNKRF